MFITWPPQRVKMHSMPSCLRVRATSSPPSIWAMGDSSYGDSGIRIAQRAGGEGAQRTKSKGQRRKGKTCDVNHLTAWPPRYIVVGVFPLRPDRRHWTIGGV